MRFLKTMVLGSLLFVANSALANECELTIDSNDQMRYDKKELSVPASCSEVTLTLTHSGKMGKKVMGHNWVLSKASDMQSVVQQGMAAGLDNNYTLTLTLYWQQQTLLVAAKKRQSRFQPRVWMQTVTTSSIAPSLDTQPSCKVFSKLLNS